MSQVSLTRTIGRMGLRTKLLLVYLGLSSVLFCSGGLGALYLVKHTIGTHIESDLQKGTHAIINLVETTAQGSIVNYLRAVAERNLEMVRNAYTACQNGTQTKQQVQAAARSILLSQVIGKSGYVYCVDSHGIAVVHPNPGVEGNNWSHHDFVHKQTQLKTGYLEYDWQNPGEEAPRPKALYMTYFEPFDWIISVSSYRDEFRELLPMTEIRQSVKALEYGPSGYAFVTDREGNFIVHPELEGRNILKVAGQNTEFFEKMRTEAFGQVTYLWQNPGEKQAREKFAIFGHIPELQWVVGTTGYVDELFAPVHRARLNILLFIGAALFISAVLTLLVSGSITRRIEHLTAIITRGEAGDLAVRATPGPSDEIGVLARMYNTFLERLQRYHSELNAEAEEHRATAYELRQSETRFEAVFNHTFHHLGILDPDGTIRNINQTALDFSGLGKSDLIDRKFWELSYWEHGRETQSQIKQAVGEAARGEFVRLEVIHRRHDGEERFIDFSIKPVHDASGRVTLLIPEGRDIHERKEAEEVLRLSEEKYRVLVENAHDAIFIVQDGMLGYSNQSAELLFGDSTEVLRGKPLDGFIHPEDRSMVMQRHRDRLEGLNPPNFYAFRILDRNGTIRWVELNAVRINWEARPAIMCFARDMTSQKQMESQLLQSQKMEAIGTLAGGIAHDFNNSLQAITGYTQLLQMGGYGEERQAKMLNTIQHACNHARELTRQLLTFGRKIESRLAPLDMNIELRAVINLIRRTLPRMIEVNTHFAKDLRIVEADQTQFEQIIMNLGINAGHAMPDGGRLTIATGNADLDESFCNSHLGAVPGAYAMVSVTDTGLGMDSDTRQHIFEPFFTTRETGAGTGLGLAMVYGIVKNHKGYITCESEPDQGTTFNIYFPAAVKKAALKAIPKENQAVEGGNEFVMVVDDEQTIRELARQVLERYGYRVCEAEDGETALEQCRRLGPKLDLILLDLNMPGMGGVHCLEGIRAFNRDIPVLIASGYFPKGEVKASLDKLAQGFVNKPYELTTLLRIVRKTLNPMA